MVWRGGECGGGGRRGRHHAQGSARTCWNGRRVTRGGKSGSRCAHVYSSFGSRVNIICRSESDRDGIKSGGAKTSTSDNSENVTKEMVAGVRWDPAQLRWVRDNRKGVKSVKTNKTLSGQEYTVRETLSKTCLKWVDELMKACH